MPPSPSSLSFPGHSPSRDTPNSHPYAIKTSSSAVLTRSNSTGHRYHANHHYTPISISRNSVGTKTSRYVPSHKHSRSVPSASADSAMIPPPIPLPPSSTLPARLANQGHTKGELGIVSDCEGVPPTPPLTWRVKRGETLPSVFRNRSDSEIRSQDLPINPKAWTPAQLSVYLSSALRMKGGAELPVPVVRLDGRAFLRMNKEDYDALGIDQLWKDTLLDASRALRQNLVQGRIMGFESGLPQSTPSTEELPLVPEEDDLASNPLQDHGPLGLSRRRTPSSAPRQWDEDKKRMGKTCFRAGRVRGMVQTYERSYSESSASGSECEGQEDVPAQFDSLPLVCEPEDEGGFASGEETSATDDEGNTTMVSEPSSAKGPAEGKPAFPQHVGESPSPPSVEALLHEQESSGLQGHRYHSWGAKAWEDEVNNPTSIRVTAKKIPLDTETVSEKARPREPDNAESTSVGSVPKGLAELFSQLTIDETPPSKGTRDVGVIAKDGVENGLRAPDPAVYELLEALQTRLEIVENRLDEMEPGDKEKDKLSEVGQDREEEKAVAKHDDVDGRYELHRCPSSGGVLHHIEPEKGQQVSRNYMAMDPSITELPRYMFLVSLGVVAVTTRVMLQRMIGDKRRV